ncbi:MAG: methylaspartate mutase [Gammaproteobacteria bacterium]|nr:methylaspartate mutase [Gammaproteobacteria bacterium]
MIYNFSDYINEMKRANKLVVQPRMGFGTLDKMKQGLLAVANCNAPTIGTLTLDSYTRVNDFISPKIALDSHQEINGFPIVTHGAIATRELLDGIVADKFAVQVRHGTALPVEIIKVLLAAGINATEGGPISYCLPYSRLPIENAISAWATCCELLASSREKGIINHLESFAGCMLGQLCPPSLLLALGILEGIFFKRHGLVSVSLSYAQGPSAEQDLSALAALHVLANEYLSDIDWHIVVYTYMGVFPKTIAGASEIIKTSAQIAKIGNAQRLIVKTPAEAFRIPTIEENVKSLELAYSASKNLENNNNLAIDLEEQEIIYHQARFLVESVLDLHCSLNKGLQIAFKKGYLDVPYCLHQNNKNLTRSVIDSRGYLQWAETGNLPFSQDYLNDFSKRKIPITSDGFLFMLGFVQHKYDNVKSE